MGLDILRRQFIQLFFDLFTGHQMALLTAARSERMGEINAAYLDNGTIAIIH
jgi:hypothetical protein